MQEKGNNIHWLCCKEGFWAEIHCVCLCIYLLFCCSDNNYILLCCFLVSTVFGTSTPTYFNSLNCVLHLFVHTLTHKSQTSTTTYMLHIKCTQICTQIQNGTYKKFIHLPVKLQGSCFMQRSKLVYIYLCQLCGRLQLFELKLMDTDRHVGYIYVTKRAKNCHI